MTVIFPQQEREPEVGELFETGWIGEFVANRLDRNTYQDSFESRESVYKAKSSVQEQSQVPMEHLTINGKETSVTADDMIAEHMMSLRTLKDDKHGQLFTSELDKGESSARAIFKLQVLDSFLTLASRWPILQKYRYDPASSHRAIPIDDATRDNKLDDRKQKLLHHVLKHCDNKYEPKKIWGNVVGLRKWFKQLTVSDEVSHVKSSKSVAFPPATPYYDYNEWVKLATDGEKKKFLSIKELTDLDKGYDKGQDPNSASESQELTAQPEPESVTKLKFKNILDEAIKHRLRNTREEVADAKLESMRKIFPSRKETKRLLQNAVFEKDYQEQKFTVLKNFFMHVVKTLGTALDRDHIGQKGPDNDNDMNNSVSPASRGAVLAADGDRGAKVRLCLSMF